MFLELRSICVCEPGICENQNPEALLDGTTREKKVSEGHHGVLRFMLEMCSTVQDLSALRSGLAQEAF